MATDRRRLRATFNSVAKLYEQARPGYPAQLYDRLVEWTRIHPADRLLEVGCATGKATIPLARRGFQITCIEIGPDLAAAARRNLAGFPDVEIVEGDFETWHPPARDRFALVFAATAWHWIDPAVRYRRAWKLLRPGGHLAFWSATHVIPEDGDPFFAELQDVYVEIGEGMPADAIWLRPGDLPEHRDEILRGGFFEDVVVCQFDWEVRYTAEEYVTLLDTFSGHIAMETAKRDRLYAEIRRRVGQRPDGSLRRHWAAALHVARRADPDRSTSP